MPFFVCHSAAKRRNLLFHPDSSVILRTCRSGNITSTFNILASRSRSLYVGFTNDIRPRIKQHREKRLGTHATKYNIGRLVYYPHLTYVLNAIAREKELKDWNRPRKIALIEQHNPTWEDLAAGW